MKLKTELIFRPTKVEDELPKKEGYYFSNDEEKEDIHWFGNWFGSGVIRHFLLKTWFKPTKAFVFTSEELKQLLQDYTDKIVENTKISRESTGKGELSDSLISDFFKGDLGYEDYIPVEYTIYKESITNQLEPFLKTIT